MLSILPHGAKKEKRHCLSGYEKKKRYCHLVPAEIKLPAFQGREIFHRAENFCVFGLRAGTGRPEDPGPHSEHSGPKTEDLPERLPPTYFVILPDSWEGIRYPKSIGILPLCGREFSQTPGTGDLKRISRHVEAGNFSFAGYHQKISKITPTLPSESSSALAKNKITPTLVPRNQNLLYRQLAYSNRRPRRCRGRPIANPILRALPS